MRSSTTPTTVAPPQCRRRSRRCCIRRSPSPPQKTTLHTIAAESPILMISRPADWRLPSRPSRKQSSPAFPAGECPATAIRIAAAKIYNKRRLPSQEGTGACVCGKGLRGALPSRSASSLRAIWSRRGDRSDERPPQRGVLCGMAYFFSPTTTASWSAFRSGS